MDRAPEGEEPEPGGRPAKRLRRHLRARFPGDEVDELMPPEGAPDEPGDDDPPDRGRGSSEGGGGTRS